MTLLSGLKHHLLINKILQDRTYKKEAALKGQPLFYPWIQDNRKKFLNAVSSKSLIEAFTSTNMILFVIES